MIELTNINENGLLHICMAILDMVVNDGKKSITGHGMYVGGTYLTSETCYWLYNLLQECPELDAKRMMKPAMDMLSKGFNDHETF